MDTLIKTICDKTGISEDQAKKAVDLVREHLGDKLPGPIGEQVQKVLDGGGGEAGDSGAGGLLGKVQGLLGKD